MTWWRLLWQRLSRDPYLTVRVPYGKTFTMDITVMLIAGSGPDAKGDCVLVLRPVKRFVFYDRADL